MPLQSPDPSVEFCCPGESRPISRAVHLARLATGYGKCRECPMAAESGRLSARLTRQLAQVVCRSSRRPLFEDESFGGLFPGQITRADVRRFAYAFASQTDGGAVTVARHGDGAGGELTSALVEGLRWSGLDVADAGASTWPRLAALCRETSSAGLLLGNPTGAANLVGVTACTAEGPLRADGWERVQRRYEQGEARPSRTAGRLLPRSSDRAYWDAFRDRFHGLRPLAVVIETTSKACAEFLAQLAPQVGCLFIVNPFLNPLPRAANEQSALARAVQQHAADLGLWIDGDGASCRMVDEQGRSVSQATLFRLVLDEHLARQAVDRIVLAASVAGELGRVAAQREVAWHRAEETRAAMYDSLLRRGAVLGCDSRRVWFSHVAPAPDALHVLASVLQLLSQSDRPLSHVAG